MKALIHYTTFLFSSSQEKSGSSNIFVFFIISYHVLDVFRLGKPKKITSICIPTDGNFPTFENSTFSSRRKQNFIFPSIFSRIRYTVTFCELWSLVIPFHSSVELQLNWSTFPKKFPGQQIACIINKKISFTMFSVSVFLLWCKNT